MNDNDQILIIGHTGAGKSTISKIISELTGLKVYSFHVEGRIMGENPSNVRLVDSIKASIVDTIMDAILFEKQIIIDGLSSYQIVNELELKGISFFVIFLDTPYRKRLQNIMQREKCSYFQAVSVEKCKETAKTAAGIDWIIEKADIVIDGNSSRIKIKGELEFILKN